MDPRRRFDRPSTGAAYVVISHGENGEGAYSNQGVLQAGISAPGPRKPNKRNELCLRISRVGRLSTSMTFPSYPAGTGHFDDFVLRPSILTVATKAQLGPRAH